MARDTTLNHNKDNFQQVLGMLGEETVEDFANQPKDNRRAVFRKYLVENDPIEFDDFHWQDCGSIYAFMLFKEHMGSGEVEQRLIQEARHIFYEENTFIVRSDLLGDFMSDQLGHWTDAVAVESLVRDIAITVDRRYCRSEDMAKSLRSAFRFTDVERIEVEVLDRGVPDGSDMATQATIKQISGVVRELIGHFGRLLEISKVLFWDANFNRGYSYCPAVYYDIRSYWDAPTETARQKLWKGQASFEELMQIQIAEWTDANSDPYPLDAVKELIY